MIFSVFHYNKPKQVRGKEKTIPRKYDARQSQYNIITTP